MARPRHMHKEIERVIVMAERAGWTVRHSSKGHAWGVLLCGHRARDGCRIVVYSTPRNPEGDARRLARTIGKCDHRW